MDDLRVRLSDLGYDANGMFLVFSCLEGSNRRTVMPELVPLDFGGTVAGSNSEKGTGVEWRFHPGQEHPLTCSTLVVSSGGAAVSIARSAPRNASADWCVARRKMVDGLLYGDLKALAERESDRASLDRVFGPGPRVRVEGDLRLIDEFLQTVKVGEENTWIVEYTDFCFPLE
jgi:hypothetical protein